MNTNFGINTTIKERIKSELIGSNQNEKRKIVFLARNGNGKSYLWNLLLLLTKTESGYSKKSKKNQKLSNNNVKENRMNNEMKETLKNQVRQEKENLKNIKDFCSNEYKLSSSYSFLLPW